MLTNEQKSLSATIGAGESLMIQDSPAQAADKSEVVEKTTTQQTNESIDLVETEENAPEPAEVLGENSKETTNYVSGSAKAREQGERMRKLAEGILELAEGDENNNERVREMIKSDPNLDKYFQNKWAKKYAQLMEGKTEVQYDEDRETLIKTAKAEAKVEAFKEYLQEVNLSEAYNLAEKLAFTKTEAESLVNLAKKLEGEEIAGNKLDYTEALKRAAFMIRPEKAKAGISQRGSMLKAPSEGVKSNKDDATANAIAKKFARNPEDVKKGLATVDKNYQNGVFTFGT